MATRYLQGTRFNDHIKARNDGATHFIKGYSGDDMLTGGIGNDHLDGGADDDILYGADGMDVLSGGRGNDRVDGGRDSIKRSLETPITALTCAAPVLSTPEKDLTL